MDTVDSYQAWNSTAGQSSLPFMGNQEELSYQDYTLGWICALEVEMTAARMVLDIEHPVLPNPITDDNCYVYGSIYSHNVVITCLPAGIYGKSSAAGVATTMAITFPSIRTYLLVGVGGGVPLSVPDIRLGDVVVGVPTSEYPAVIQYDYGKDTPSGFKQKGNLDKPDKSLLTAVTKMRSSHRLRASLMQKIILDALKRFPSAQEFSHPGPAKDILYEPDCDHATQDRGCHCAATRPFVRPPRDDKVPRVYYGPIASGDKVIKDRRVRDQVAHEHGIMCFEMEAAGLMDKLHALVIRGISDYCDSAKAKDFQPYAALTAAAYAKELLSVLPVRDPRQEAKRRVTRDELMSALKFSAMDRRRTNIRQAHVQTCRWLLTHPAYTKWLKSKRYGAMILWIKGKAGSGKSTVMKFLLENVLSVGSKNQVVLSFFFNARGGELEKSTLGLYRSLLVQLLTQFPALQQLLDDSHSDGDWTLDDLIGVFKAALGRLPIMQYTFFIDALDECKDSQVWEMIGFFEDLSAFTQSHQKCLRILFASRHYPNIVITGAEYMVLESLADHSSDIQRYVEAELRLGTSESAREIQRQVVIKSSGIFLWVVLVVMMLKETFAKGRVHEVSKRLAEIPPDLDLLFREILLRDNENIGDLVSCLQWLLYSGRSLRRNELYLALRNDAGLVLTTINNDLLGAEQMENMLIDSSKGLIELTKSNTIQFIHESVREFLMNPITLVKLHPEFKHALADSSHHQLCKVCYQQMQALDDYDFARINAEKQHRVAFDPVASDYPLAFYSSEFILYHAENSLDGSQLEFLQTFDVVLWYRMKVVIGRIRQKELLPREEFLLILIEARYQRLLEAWWSIWPPDEAIVLAVGSTLFQSSDSQALKIMLSAYYRSVFSNNTGVDHVDAILELRGKIQFKAKLESCMLLVYLAIFWHQPEAMNKLDHALSMALDCKCTVAVRQFIARGAVCEARHLVRAVSLPTDHTASHVPWRRIVHEERQLSARGLGQRGRDPLLQDVLGCVTILLNQPFVATLSRLETSLVMHQAIEWTDGQIANVLRESLISTHPNIADALTWSDVISKCNSSQAALFQRNPTSNQGMLDHIQRPARRMVVDSCLMQIGTDVESCDAYGNTYLHSAIMTGDIYMAKFLVSHGATTTKTNKRNETPLQLTIARYRATVTANCWDYPLILHSVVADLRPNFADVHGNTWLHLAVEAIQKDFVNMLLYCGTDVEARNKQQRTPLHSAIIAADREVVLDLLLQGAKPQSMDSQGNTCLHLAARQGNADMINVLIHFGADANVRNNEGYTPLALLFITNTMSEPSKAALALYNHGAPLENFDHMKNMDKDLQEDNEREEEEAAPGKFAIKWPPKQSSCCWMESIPMDVDITRLLYSGPHKEEPYWHFASVPQADSDKAISDESGSDHETDYDRRYRRRARRRLGKSSLRPRT